MLENFNNTENRPLCYLSLEDVIKVKVGMSVDEVEEIIGRAHDNSGKKYLGHVYYLADGSEVAVIYDNFGVFRITHEKNGKKVILLEK